MVMEKKKILTIDDEEAITKLLKLNVEDALHYEVITANSGEEGLTLIEREKPDLVLLDIMMPGIDGFETLRRIKKINKDLPVCMVTAVHDDQEGEKCFNAGAYDYITKPIDFEYLKKAILVKLEDGLIK